MDAVKTGFSKFPGSLGAAVEEGKVPGHASDQEGRAELEFILTETLEICVSLAESEASLIVVLTSCWVSVVPCAFEAFYFDAYEKKHWFWTRIVFL